jgi:hypothetical protein
MLFVVFMVNIVFLFSNFSKHFCTLDRQSQWLKVRRRLFVIRKIYTLRTLAFGIGKIGIGCCRMDVAAKPSGWINGVLNWPCRCRIMIYGQYKWVLTGIIFGQALHNIILVKFSSKIQQSICEATDNFCNSCIAELI